MPNWSAAVRSAGSLTSAIATTSARGSRSQPGMCATCAHRPVPTTATRTLLAAMNLLSFGSRAATEYRGRLVAGRAVEDVAQRASVQEAPHVVTEKVGDERVLPGGGGRGVRRDHDIRQVP